MIINTGGRTDTVQYYTDWLLRRFVEGYVLVRNPRFPEKVTRYELDPSVVDCVVFCSKNYAPILPRLHEITDRFNTYFFYTITAYGRDMEPGVPDIDASIEMLIELERIVGRERIVWRYDRTGSCSTPPGSGGQTGDGRACTTGATRSRSGASRAWTRRASTCAARCRSSPATWGTAARRRPSGTCASPRRAARACSGAPRSTCPASSPTWERCEMDGLEIHVTGFFASYLPNARGASPNTAASYRDAIAQFLGFCAERSLRRVEGLGMADVDGAALEAFLDHIERERGVCVSTRNQRLAAVHALFRYIQLRDPAWMEVCASVLAVRKKRCPPPDVGYIGIGGMRAILASPDPSTPAGLAHLAAPSLLYESAARAQELIDVRVGDLAAGCSAVVLHGKGGRTRAVPLGRETSSILKRHVAAAGVSGDDPLVPGRHGKMTRSGLRYIVEKHAGAARAAGADVPRRVTPHMFRHSRAMHLLEAGVNLIYIRDLLGHASVTTTEIYARANPEMRRRAIEERSAGIAPAGAYTDEEKADLLSWLKGMDW